MFYDDKKYQSQLSFYQSEYYEKGMKHSLFQDPGEEDEQSESIYDVPGKWWERRKKAIIESGRGDREITTEEQQIKKDELETREEVANIGKEQAENVALINERIKQFEVGNSIANEQYKTAAGALIEKAKIEIDKYNKSVENARDRKNTDRLQDVITTQYALHFAKEAEKDLRNELLASNPNADIYSVSLFDKVTLDPRKFGLTGEPTEVPEMNQFNISEFGFERVDESKGLMSEFQFYYVPDELDDPSVAGAVTKWEDDSGVAKVISNSDKDKLEKVTKRSDGTFVDASGNIIPKEKLFAIPSYQGSPNNLVLVQADEAEKTFLNQSLSGDGQKYFYALDSVIDDPFLRRELADILSEWQQSGFLMTLVKVALTLFQNGADGGDLFSGLLGTKKNADENNITADDIKKINEALENAPQNLKDAFNQTMGVMNGFLKDGKLVDSERKQIEEYLKNTLNLADEDVKNLMGIIKGDIVIDPEVLELRKMISDLELSIQDKEKLESMDMDMVKESFELMGRFGGSTDIPSITALFESIKAGVADKTNATDLSAHSSAIDYVRGN